MVRAMNSPKPMLLVAWSSFARREPAARKWSAEPLRGWASGVVNGQVDILLITVRY